MIYNREILTKDPYLLSGNQITYNYGIFSYIISGALYKWFGMYTIDIITTLLVIVLIFIADKIIKNDPITKSFIILSLTIFTIPDSYVALFSLTFLWISFYLADNKTKWWIVPMIIACINHPVSIIPALYFVLKDKNVIFIFGAISAYFAAIIYLMSINKTSFNITYLLMSIIRIGTMILPIFVNNNMLNDVISNIKPALKSKEAIKILDEIFYSRINIVRIIAIVIALSFIVTTGNQIAIMNKFEEYKLVFIDVAEGFPQNLNGSIKVVDYYLMPAIYYFPLHNITLADGSYRENSHTKIPTKVYTSKKEYEENVKQYDYVLICKYCIATTNDRYFLDKYYTLVWNNSFYDLYKI